MKINIPPEISITCRAIADAGFSAYLVGGCVRDIVLKKELTDWDIATEARPEEIQEIFHKSVYENAFGTVALKIEPTEKVKSIEITTFRLEGKYTDKRHPDEIKFAKTIEEDLARRDFTINAMALQIKNAKIKIQNDNLKFKIIDPFNGQKDLENKLIRAVGDPNERFEEDALRLMRAVRFAASLGFEIEKNTADAIRQNAHLLEYIARERIRDELVKIVMTSRAREGVEILENLGLLRFIIPELREGIGVSQNKHHIYTVWEHNLRALEYAAKNGYSLEVRLASLLHDVGKPRTKSGEGPDCTFYGHEIVGAKMAAKILYRLKFPNASAEHIIHLVRYHLFYYNVGEVTETGVRRFLRRVGDEFVDDLLKVREADRIGSGVPKAVPYRLRHLRFMIEKAKRDPISPRMLKLNGDELMSLLRIAPGPRVGHILNALLDEVVEDPKRNTSAYLKKRAKSLNLLKDGELAELRKKAENTKEEFESGVEAEMKKRYYV